MKEKLIAYIDALFRSASQTPKNLELKEELTRNTIDHYEDLLTQGVSEEAAFRRATESIGDIKELLEQPPYKNKQQEQPPKKRKGRGPLCAAINGGIWALTITVYVLLSLWTKQWSLTWILFIMAIAADNIVEAIFDLCKGGMDHEEE